MSKARSLTVAEGSDGGFEPSSVPMYPMLRAEIRDTDNGEYVGLVDDEVVASDLDVEPVRAAIVTTAARSAARRLGDVKAIRVQVRSGADVFQTVVTAAGEVFDLTDAPAGTSSSSSTSKRGKSTKAAIATPDAEDAAKFRFHPILLVILGFPILMIAFFAWILFFRGGETSAPPKAPEARQLPVVAPQGYAPVATWAVKTGTASGTTTGGVAADERRVYAATGSSDHITAYAAVDGMKQWSVDLDGPLTAGPALTKVDGETVLAAATSSKLVTLSPSTGRELGEWKLDQTAASQVRITVTGPVVIGRANTAQIIVDGDLKSRIMPAGALPVAPGPGGSLIAVTHDRVYASVSDKLSGEGRPISPGGPGTVSVAAWTGQRLVLAYATASTASTGAQLAGYAVPDDMDGSWDRTWASTLTTSSSTSGAFGVQLPLTTGPSGRWGVYGSTLVDLRNGKTIELGEWSTVSVGDDIAFGVGPTEVLSAGPAGLGGHSDPEPSSIQVTAPQAVHGSSAYLITGGGTTEAWLYALTPARDRSGQ